MRRLLARADRASPETAARLADWPVTPPPPATDRSEVRSAVRRFLLAGLVVLLVAAVPAVWWVRAVAEEHAVEHVLHITERLANYAVAPLITDEMTHAETLSQLDASALVRA